MKANRITTIVLITFCAVAAFMLLARYDTGRSGAAMAEEKAEASSPEIAPAFTLTDSQGKEHSLSDYKDKWVVLEWVNHGCPFVKKFYDADKMQELQQQYTDKGVIWLSICSSAEGKQGYNTPEQWEKINKDMGVHATAVLLDPEGTVGHQYGARTTPHMFVINPKGEIVYKGGIDDKRSPNKETLKTAHNYVVAALDAGLAGKPIETQAAPPYGCSVKYK